MSLLYECIQTSIVGGMLNGRDGEALAKSCVDKLKGFLEDADQNRTFATHVRYSLAVLTQLCDRSTVHRSGRPGQDFTHSSSSRFNLS